MTGRRHDRPSSANIYEEKALFTVEFLNDFAQRYGLAQIRFLPFDALNPWCVSPRSTSENGEVQV